MVDNKRPFFVCEDFQCQRNRVTSSCNEKRVDILITEALVSMIYNCITDDCSSAFACLMNFLDQKYLTCNNFCELNTFI